MHANARESQEKDPRERAGDFRASRLSGFVVRRLSRGTGRDWRGRRSLGSNLPDSLLDCSPSSHANASDMLRPRATRFVNIDRATPMLLPCDLRDWQPPDHLVHFILEAVEQLPLGVFSCNARGTGSEPYPPAMMLALLIYSYATGRTGSRTMEAATHSDVAVRYLCANTHPDHATIGEFRTQNEAAAAAVEPVFGIIKEVMGFRRFLLRGREKVSLEWTLVCVSYNLKRMFTLKNLVPAG